MKRILFLVLIAVAISLGLRLFVFEGIVLASNSMAPTLPEGRHIFANKVPLLFREPKRGEIIVFNSPHNEGKGFVKRVIGVPGDVVEIRRKQVFLNRKPLDEPYKIHLREDERLVGDNMDPIQIPEGYVFVLGDNRDFSKDSRDWLNPEGEWSPYVPLSEVTGVLSE